MSGQRHRLSAGGRIDRARPLSFRFEGRAYTGYAGDTLAAALLANGVRLVGRSFKYHRPRGLLAAGVEEPNALVQLGEGARSEPNLRATEIDLFDGLVARAVNCWPSLRFDLGTVNDLLSRFLPAGFYYKTFMWPDWHLFEGAIRRPPASAARRMRPIRRATRRSSPHCDVLVVGGGPAGLAAARAAARTGARVILCEQEARLGGRLNWDPAAIDGVADWIGDAEKELRATEETQVLLRCTAMGYFDHNAMALLERFETPNHWRQRLWQVRAREIILATGALERPLVFPGNDRPGVMLASAVRRYLAEHAVRAGDRAAIFTNNNEAYVTAHALPRLRRHGRRRDRHARRAAVRSRRCPAHPRRRDSGRRGCRRHAGTRRAPRHQREAARRSGPPHRLRSSRRLRRLRSAGESVLPVRRQTRL